jgi:hypothetical protein
MRRWQRPKMMLPLVSLIPPSTAIHCYPRVLLARASNPKPSSFVAVVGHNAGTPGVLISSSPSKVRQRRRRASHQYNSLRKILMESPPQSPEAEYIDEFYRWVGEERAEPIRNRCRSQFTTSTRAVRHTVQEQHPVSLTQVARLARVHPQENTILVVENADLNWIATLGLTFHLDPFFFAQHASNSLERNLRPASLELVGRPSKTDTE